MRFTVSRGDCNDAMVKAELGVELKELRCVRMWRGGNGVYVVLSVLSAVLSFALLGVFVASACRLAGKMVTVTSGLLQRVWISPTDPIPAVGWDETVACCWVVWLTVVMEGGAANNVIWGSTEGMLLFNWISGEDTSIGGRSVSDMIVLAIVSSNCCSDGAKMTVSLGGDALALLDAEVVQETFVCVDMSFAIAWWLFWSDDVLVSSLDGWVGGSALLSSELEDHGTIDMMTYVPQQRDYMYNMMSTELVQSHDWLVW